MKTHELARALNQLAKVLLAGPNVELSQIEVQSSDERKATAKEQIEVNLATLLALSKIDKRQWTALIEDHKFPIVIDARDSSRNIMDRVLKYLNSNPEAAENIKQDSAKRISRGSSELSQALSSLLGTKQ